MTAIREPLGCFRCDTCEPAAHIGEPLVCSYEYPHAVTMPGPVMATDGWSAPTGAG
jgi:hypothetical protein